MGDRAERNPRFETREDELQELASLFRIFGDSTRLSILSLLSEGEKNVSDLSEELSMQQSAVSHQLTVLRNSKLVKTRREGKSIFYSLADSHVESIFAIGLEHINE